MMTKSKLIFASLLFGVGLGGPVAFADDWDHERDKLRRAEEELGKDTRQYGEARSHGDRRGMENEAREIQKDRAEIANQRARLNGMRGSYDVDRGWGGYEGRDDRDWNNGRGRGWAWGHHKDDRDDYWRGRGNHGERGDAWRELHKDQAELRKDQEEKRDAWRRGDRRGVQNEQREIWQDKRELESDRDRLHDLHH